MLIPPISIPFGIGQYWYWYWYWYQHHPKEVLFVKTVDIP